MKESKVSIIANTCWGGLTYNQLGLEFLSPFINMYIDSQDYQKLLRDFKYYIERPLHFIKEGYEPRLKRNYPVVGLEDIILHFNHYTDFESADIIWKRRKERLNYNNLFVKMIIECKEDIDRFHALPFEHKIGFTSIKCNEKDIIYFPIESKEYFKRKYDGQLWSFLNCVASDAIKEYRPYDILKLLNHEKDYMRIVMHE